MQHKNRGNAAIPNILISDSIKISGYEGFFNAKISIFMPVSTIERQELIDEQFKIIFLVNV